MWEGLGAAEGQVGLGLGVMICGCDLLMVPTTAFSAMGKGREDPFITGLIGLIIAMVGVLAFFPVAHILAQAFEVEDGGFSIWAAFPRFFSSDIWGLGCLSGGRCGPAVNSVVLGVMTSTGTTVLGLAFALVFRRTDFRAKRVLRVLTIIPIITPPFLIGLALILLVGRTGTITEFAADLFGIEATRWLHDF